VIDVCSDYINFHRYEKNSTILQFTKLLTNLTLLCRRTMCLGLTASWYNKNVRRPSIAVPLWDLPDVTDALTPALCAWSPWSPASATIVSWSPPSGQLCVTDCRRTWRHSPRMRRPANCDVGGRPHLGRCSVDLSPSACDIATATARRPSNPN